MARKSETYRAEWNTLELGKMTQGRKSASLDGQENERGSLCLALWIMMGNMFPVWKWIILNISFQNILTKVCTSH